MRLNEIFIALCLGVILWASLLLVPAYYRGATGCGLAEMPFCELVPELLYPDAFWLPSAATRLSSARGLQVQNGHE